jgi:hypothetical protein
MNPPVPLKVGALMFPNFEILKERLTITTVRLAIGEVKSHQGPKSVADQPLTQSDDLCLALALNPGNPEPQPGSLSTPHPPPFV